MTNQQLSTVQISIPMKEKLRALATFHRRTLAGQLEVLVDQAYLQLRSDVVRSQIPVSESSQANQIVG
jgi:hypothetical protein